MKAKRNIIRKLVCLMALFTMLIGSTLTASAKEKGYDEGEGYRYVDSTGRWKA